MNRATASDEIRWKMELDWACNEEGQRRALCYSIGVEARGEENQRPGQPKTTWRRMIEEERHAVRWQSWTTVRALAAN